MDHQHDIFIAYHGTTNEIGTFPLATELCRFLCSKGIDAISHTIAPDKSYGSDLYDEIYKSKRFLLIANEHIDRDPISGKLTSAHIKKELTEFERGYNAKSTSGMVKVMICGSLSPEEADKLHRLFDSEPVIDNTKDKAQSVVFDDVQRWIANVASKRDTQTQSATVNATIGALVGDLKDGNVIAVLGSRFDDFHAEFISEELRVPNADKLSFSKTCEAAKGTDILKRYAEFFANKGTVSYRDLVKLPFSAYITLNADNLLEKALRETKKECASLTVEGDLVDWDFADEIPVFKIFGTIDRPETVNFQQDNDSNGIFEDKQELRIFLQQMLRRKKLLFVGFDAVNNEYRTVNALLKKLGNATDNIAILSDCKQATSIESFSDSALSEIHVNADEFINQLIHTYEGNRHSEDSEFMHKLFYDIASTPTETQAIDLFLEFLNKDLRKIDVSDEKALSLFDKVIIDADSNHEQLMKRKANFNAFDKFWKDMLVAIGKDPTNKLNTALTAVKKVIKDRGHISDMIAENAEPYLVSPRKIFVYSQSLRVLDILVAAEQSFQQNSHLYIGECRPKSKLPFDDSKNIVNYLDKHGSQYKTTTLIPDMSFYNLMQRKLIDTVLIGAHDVLFSGENPVAFINTCGAAVIVELAH
ncbi:MAG: SIR2 family protein, partial [Clostridiales bacterium]|nr:SIR2 family protein [Clostridiales bacterium]